MLTGLSILIAEDEALIALSLSDAVEEQGGHIVGPVATVAEGLALAGHVMVTAAILDANLLDRDITPLALRLIEQHIPFVIHTGTGLPEDLVRAHPDLAVVMKPVPPSVVLQALDLEIARVTGGLTIIPAETMRLDVAGPGEGMPG